MKNRKFFKALTTFISGLLFFCVPIWLFFSFRAHQKEMIANKASLDPRIIESGLYEWVTHPTTSMLSAILFVGCFLGLIQMLRAYEFLFPRSEEEIKEDTKKLNDVMREATLEEAKKYERYISEAKEEVEKLEKIKSRLEKEAEDYSDAR